MMPDGVLSGVPLVYSKVSPGSRVGCSPTTPAPCTSCTRPIESVMRQWRFRRSNVPPPVFSSLTWLAQTAWQSVGEDCSSRSLGLAGKRGMAGQSVDFGVDLGGSPDRKTKKKEET